MSKATTISKLMPENIASPVFLCTAWRSTCVTVNLQASYRLQARVHNYGWPSWALPQEISDSYALLWNLRAEIRNT